MDHPPIPKSPYFAERDGLAWFVVFDENFKVVLQIALREPGIWRQIIAMVAECQWNYLGESRDAVNEVKNAKKDDDGFSCDDCYRIACEWRSWGARK